MASAHVVIRCVNKSVLRSVKRLAGVRIKKVISRTSNQRLRAESGLLIDAEARIEPGEFVVLIDKFSIRCQKSNEGILRADVALQTQHADFGVLVQNAGQLRLSLSHAGHISG